MSQVEVQYDEFVSSLSNPTHIGIHQLTAVGQMNIDIIEEISKDQDIEYISGTVTPASY